MAGYRYGPYTGGPDPLEPPYDVRGAVDALGDAVLDGTDAVSALRDLLRRGMSGHRGLDDLLRRVRERQREVRSRGRLDGILDQVRTLLDTAIGQERAELFPDPDDAARIREAELDSLPSDTAQAIRQLADYDWRSSAARATFEELKSLLRREVLDSQFRGMRQTLAEPDPRAMQRVKEMMAALNAMLDADARGEHTQQDFDNFMASYGDMFPDSPANLEELVDTLVRRMSAAQRLLDSLTDEQRDELAGLMSQALEDAGLAAEMGKLGDALRARRPDMDAGWPQPGMTGNQPLGLGDATEALAELADLADLEDALRQDYAGARLDDIDEEAVSRALGRQAVDDMEALRQIERELERQGYLQRSEGKLELTPKAVRRLGQTALRKVFAELPDGGIGDHDQRDAGQAGEITGSTRPWRFGDEQAIDAAATVRNALLRQPAAAGRVRPSGRVQLSVHDFEVTETERRASAAVCLLVDLSYSMALRGTWGAAKQTALALHALIHSQYPQDAIQVIGFSNYARELKETELAGLSWDMVQGTNLHHALVLAGRFLDRRPEHNPVVMIITDGEPTAHLRRDGRFWFDWPPSPETLELTLAEVDKMTRRRATLNVFMLADDERLTSFVDEVARRNGGRVLRAMPDSLGEYVVRDFLRTRRQFSR
ncbi:MAG: vWA domain-containing protein [Streptosporangiaceae bacterium]